MRRLIVFLLLLLPLFLHAKYPASPYGNGKSTTSFKCPRGITNLSYSYPQMEECKSKYAELNYYTCLRRRIIYQKDWEATKVEYVFRCVSFDYCSNRKYSYDNGTGLNKRDAEQYQFGQGCKDITEDYKVWNDKDRHGNATYFLVMDCCEPNGLF